MGFGKSIEKLQTFEALKKLNLAEISQDMQSLALPTDKKADTNTQLENLKKKEIATENILENFDQLTNAFETGGYIKKEIVGNQTKIESVLQTLLGKDKPLLDNMEARPFNIDNLVQLICEDITAKYPKPEDRKNYSGKDLANFLSNRANAGASLLTAAEHLKNKITYGGEIKDKTYKQEGLATITLLIQYYLKTKGNYTGTINGIIGQTGTPKTPKGDEGKTLVEAIDKYCNYDPTYQDAKKTKEAEEEQKRKDKEQQDLDETIKKAEQDAKDKEAKEKEEAEKKQKDEQTKKETKEKLENDNKVSIGLTGKVLDIYVKNESLTDADKLTLTEDSTPMISGRNGLLDALKKNNKENGKRSEKDQFLNFKTFETALNTQTNEYEVKELEVGYDFDGKNPDERGLLYAEFIPNEAERNALKSIITTTKAYDTVFKIENGHVTQLVTEGVTADQLKALPHLQQLNTYRLQTGSDLPEGMQITVRKNKLFKVIEQKLTVETQNGQKGIMYSKGKGNAEFVPLSQFSIQDGKVEINGKK